MKEIIIFDIFFSRMQQVSTAYFFQKAKLSFNKMQSFSKML